MPTGDGGRSCRSVEEAIGFEHGGGGPLCVKKRSPRALGVGPIVGMHDGHPTGEEGPFDEGSPFGEECPFGEEGPFDEVSASVPG